MVGGSIEDQANGQEPGLIPIEQAVEHIAAAREAADDLLLDFTITARAESYFGGVADPFSDAVERANRYAAAGADCVFIPGPSDLGTLRHLVEAVAVPLSLGIGSGGAALDLKDLAEIGIRRVSTGGALLRAMYALLTAAGDEMRHKGTFSFSEGAVTESSINELMD